MEQDKPRKKMTVDELIRRTVIATRLSCAREPKDAFKATEKRLYAYPLLAAKIEDDEDALAELRQQGAHQKSHSITRFIRSGSRLEPEEVERAMIIDLESAIAADKYEIQRIDKALEQIADDEYRDIIRYKYFEQRPEDEIADLLHCSPRTVRTHKSRLVGRLSVFLYGAGALP